MSKSNTLPDQNGAAIDRLALPLDLPFALPSMSQREIVDFGRFHLGPRLSWLGTTSSTDETEKVLESESFLKWD
jgi:hypothetical protein